MKAEIRKDGTLYITAENPEEAFALKYLFPLGGDDICSECHRTKERVGTVIDCSILND